MVIFGSIGIFVRAIPLPSAQIALYRALLSVILVGLVTVFSHSRQKISWRTLKKSLPLLLLSGGALGFNWILLFEAYKYTTVSNATLAYYFAPVLVTLLSTVLFKEKMCARQWICFALSTLGIFFISGVSVGDTSPSNLLGISLGFAAACLYATVVLVNKFIKDLGGIERTLLQFAAAAIVLVPYTVVSGNLNFSPIGIDSIASILIVGLLHTGLAYCLYFSAIKGMRGQEVSVISYLDPLVAIMASLLILHEPLSLCEIIGGLLILGSAIFNEIKIKNK